ncbi:hypothetical protein BH11ACT3_BH11ACT3_25820 [soil metagenome]
MARPMSRPSTVLRTVPFVLFAPLLLTACGGPATAETGGGASPEPKTVEQACTDLGDAVSAFYELASPGSTAVRLDITSLPEPNGVRIPKPDCAWKITPDPTVVLTQAVTYENFYLDPQTGLDGAIHDRLVAAGYTPSPDFAGYSLTSSSVSYSASVLLFSDDDGPYSVAADGPVLDFTLSQG